MKLKVYFLALVALVMAVGCVDESYDLTKVSFDDVEIGSDDSTFAVPLATVTLTSDDLDGNGIGTKANISSYGFTEILELINAFLPTGVTVEISTLIGDDVDAKEAEIERLVYVLIDELKSSEQKVADLASVIYSYKDDVDLTSFTSSTNGVLNLKTDFTEADIIDAINDYVLYTEDDYDSYIEAFADAIVALIDDEVVAQLKEYSEIDVDQSIDPVELPTEILDILDDGEKITIIATYTHNFPFEFNISSIVLKNSIGEEIIINLTLEGEDVNPTECYITDISSILESGADLTSGISLVSYTSIPVGDYAITIKVAVQKSGSIKF